MCAIVGTDNRVASPCTEAPVGTPPSSRLHPPAPRVEALHRSTYPRQSAGVSSAFVNEPRSWLARRFALGGIASHRPATCQFPTAPPERATPEPLSKRIRAWRKCTPQNYTPNLGPVYRAGEECTWQSSICDRESAFTFSHPTTIPISSIISCNFQASSAALPWK